MHYSIIFLMFDSSEISLQSEQSNWFRLSYIGITLAILHI